MIVTVTNHNTQKKTEYRGSVESVREQLQQAFPHLQKFRGGLGSMLDLIESSQGMEVQVRELSRHDDDEIRRLLRHPNPAERAMALKLDGVKLEHLLEAVHDEHPAVRDVALHHRRMNAADLLSLMRQYGKGKHQLLAIRHPDVPLGPEHLGALARTIAKHPPKEFAEIAEELGRMGMEGHLAPEEADLSKVEPYPQAYHTELRHPSPAIFEIEEDSGPEELVDIPHHHVMSEWSRNR